jgi:hypothetical protein
MLGSSTPWRCGIRRYRRTHRSVDVCFLSLGFGEIRLGSYANAFPIVPRLSPVPTVSIHLSPGGHSHRRTNSRLPQAPPLEYGYPSSTYAAPSAAPGRRGSKKKVEILQASRRIDGHGVGKMRPYRSRPVGPIKIKREKSSLVARAFSHGPASRRTKVTRVLWGT